jgi:hypothetical protein
MLDVSKSGHIADAQERPASEANPARPLRIVLVFQGGGALGAYQAGVYQALREAGIEPDWNAPSKHAQGLALSMGHISRLWQQKAFSESVEKTGHRPHARAHRCHLATAIAPHERDRWLKDIAAKLDPAASSPSPGRR